MTDDVPNLSPADPDELHLAPSLALQRDGRRRFRHVDDLMAKLVADHLIRYLEARNYVVMQKPPEAKTKKVMTDLYKVTPPDDPVLENGNKLCKGKPIAYLIVWKSDKMGNEADPRTLAPFSGPKISAGSSDDCGRYTYDAGPR